MKSPKRPSEHFPPGTLCMCYETIWLVVGENMSIVIQEDRAFMSPPGRVIEVSTCRTGWNGGWEFLEP